MNAPLHPIQVLHPSKHTPGVKVPTVAITPEIISLLNSNAVVAVGVSGGKDSQAAAIATAEFLKAIGHTGPKLLVHSDLGRVEWKESLPVCERLADHLGWELLTVRRQAGDMMDRWQVRWRNNVERYQDLSCVKLILPWSTPSMRFCTSELKVGVITSALKKRFPGQDIVNVSGIRRQESTNRARSPIAVPEAKLKRGGNIGFNWNPIIEWKIEEVFAAINAAGLDLHEAYTRYNMSRVSCVFCIMSAEGDLLAASNCADNRDVLIEMVELEAESTFAFQGNRRWLADTAPHLLPADLRASIEWAKAAAVRRQAIEARIPQHLLYTDSWPICMPTAEEARLLAGVRRDIADLLQLPNVGFITPESVTERYAQLLLEKATKEEEKRAKKEKKAAKEKLSGAAVPSQESEAPSTSDMFSIENDSLEEEVALLLRM